MLYERPIWTTIPAGFDSHGHLAISVHVAPRLTSDTTDETGLTLDQFPYFSVWPNRVENIKFKIRIGGVTADAKRASTLDPKLWSRIFPGKTSVITHAFQDHAPTRPP